MVRHLSFVLTVFVSVVSGAAFADTAPPPMAGAGVLVRNGTADCSAVLIATDLVATAAHCVGGKPLAPDGETTIVFRTGAYPGHFAVTRDAVAIFRHPLAMLPGSAGLYGADIAVLRLDEPVPETVARPMPLGRPGEKGERLLLGTWPGGQGQRARERMCNALSTEASIVTLSCIVIPGESGGAVARITEDGPELAGIVVARGKVGRQPLALAVDARRRLAQIGAIYGF